MKTLTKKKFYITKKELEDLYLKQKLSAQEIANKFNCAKSAIQRRMQKYNIKARSASEALKTVNRPCKYIISEKDLREFYIEQKKSTHEISKVYNCSASVISNRLKKYRIKQRSALEGIRLSISRRSKAIATSLIRTSRADFTGSNTEKAYLIGFRLGDLHVRKKPNGKTVYVTCTTTKIEQLILLNNLFKNYGHINIKEGKNNNFSFQCHLNSTFDFLLKQEDKIEDWILEKDKYFLSFLAGYSDAEGSFGVYNTRGSFAIGSYDKNIIIGIHYGLKELGIRTESPKLRTPAGFVDKRGVKTTKDFWTLRIRRKNELIKFIDIIRPYVKHLKRQKDIGRIEINLRVTFNNQIERGRR